MKNFADKRVLITGATGLIGSHLADKLLRNSAVVIAAGRNEKKLKDIFRKNSDNPNLICRSFDMRQGLPDELGTVDFIFHAASPISGKEIKDRPVDVIDANIEGIKNCLEYLKKQEEDTRTTGRLIIFSSATVYGNSLEGKNRIVRETDTELSGKLDNWNAPYFESKRMAEVMANAYHKQYGVDAVIARIGWVYGFSEHMPDTAFYEFIRKAAAGDDIVLSHAGLGRRDNIYVEDVVKGLTLLALYGKSGEAYNISSGQDMENFKAIDEIAEIIAGSMNEMTGKNVRAVIGKNDVGRDPGIILNNEKLKKIGWEVEMDMQDGIRETMSQYLKKGF